MQIGTGWEDNIVEITLEALLDEVVERDASDLHIGVGIPPSVRLGGTLRPVEGTSPMTAEDVERAFLEVITQEQYKKFRDTHELDFSFSHTSSGKEARFRGNCYRDMRGNAAAFRLIPMRIRTLDDLNLPPALKSVAGERRGLFLVTGPTGHGKSTTLAALVNEINETRSEHIVTIEDPIEYVHRSKRCVIHQREVGSDTFSFAEALKHVLRQDPDVILIGELRDLETIAAAVTAAETGHLVLGTLHTKDASQSIDRLIDVFPPHQQGQIRAQLASVLVGICSQQLIPTGRGSKRVLATELLRATPAVNNNIREGKTSQIRTALQTGASMGMHTMEQCLLDIVRNGDLTPDAALTFAYNTQEFRQLLKQGGFQVPEKDAEPQGGAQGGGGMQGGGMYNKPQGSMQGMQGGMYNMNMPQGGMYNMQQGGGMPQQRPMQGGMPQQRPIPGGMPQQRPIPGGAPGMTNMPGGRK